MSSIANAQLDAVLKAVDDLSTDPRHAQLHAELSQVLDKYLDINPFDNDNIWESFEDPPPDPCATSISGLSPIQLPVTIFGVPFPSCMHAFQAHKEKHQQPPIDDDVWKSRLLIYASANLSAANQMGRQVKLDVAKWDAVKDNIMHTLLKTGISQNDEKKHALMQAQDKFIEDVLPDQYWGGTSNKAGNLLDKIKQEFEKSDDDKQATRPTVWKFTELKRKSPE